MRDAIVTIPRRRRPTTIRSDCRSVFCQQKKLPFTRRRRVMKTRVSVRLIRRKSTTTRRNCFYRPRFERRLVSPDAT